MDKIRNLEKEESIKKLQEMIKAINVAMFVTKSKEEKDDVRPMAVVNVDDEGSIWFLTKKDSEKVDAIDFNENVQLIFSHPGKEMYLNIEGIADVTEDRDVIKKIWTPIAKAWFEGGVDDPDICAIKVKPDQGNYWDTQHGKLVEFLKIISTVVTGKKSGDGVSGQIAVH